ncbi:MAG TPA: MATE family efflux transporter, partial [Pirellulales bacterium]
MTSALKATDDAATLATADGPLAAGESAGNREGEGSSPIGAATGPGHEGGNPYPPGTLGELLWVAIPLMASSGTLSLMHVTDRVFLTWHSPDDLAASLPAGVLNWQLMSLFVGTVSYVNTFVAQYEGAKEKSHAAAAMWQGIYLAALAGLMILCLNPFLPMIFAGLGHAPEIQLLETEYLQALSLGAGPYLAATAMSAFFTGRGQSRAVFAVDVASVCVNAVLAYLLI